MWKIIIVIAVLTLWFAGSSFAMMGMCNTGHGKAEAAETSKDAGNTICPVTADKVDGKITYEYEGKTYNFCCPMCIDEFKKDPAKYIKKIEAEKE